MFTFSIGLSESKTFKLATDEVAVLKLFVVDSSDKVSKEEQE